MRLLLPALCVFKFACDAHAGRGPVDPGNGGIGNAILRFPLDLSAVEDYFIPSNGVFLDNVTLPSPVCFAGHL